jgi:phosphoribosyl-dephospho-CoA transferase
MNTRDQLLTKFAKAVTREELLSIVMEALDALKDNEAMRAMAEHKLKLVSERCARQAKIIDDLNQALSSNIKKN